MNITPSTASAAAASEALVAGGNKTQGLPIDPIALNYLSLFPAPTNQASGVVSNNYIASPNKTQYSNVFDVRIDHKFTDKNLFFARYTYNKINTVTPQALGTQNGLEISGGRYNFAGPATDAAQQYALNFTHIFTPSLLVDLKAAYTRINNLSLPLNYGKNADTQVGFGPNMNFNTLSNFLTPIQFGPFSDIGDGAYVPLQDIDNTFQYLGTVSWTKGNHNIKLGASLIRRQAKNLAQGDAFRAIKAIAPHSKVGSAFSMSPAMPLPSSPEDAAAANASMPSTMSGSLRQPSAVAIPKPSFTAPR